MRLETLHLKRLATVSRTTLPSPVSYHFSCLGRGEFPTWSPIPWIKSIQLEMWQTIRWPMAFKYIEMLGGGGPILKKKLPHCQGRISVENCQELKDVSCGIFGILVHSARFVSRQKMEY